MKIAGPRPLGGNGLGLDIDRGASFSGSWGYFRADVAETSSILLEHFFHGDRIALKLASNCIEGAALPDAKELLGYSMLDGDALCAIA